jgi:hypothetical protein
MTSDLSISAARVSSTSSASTGRTGADGLGGRRASSRRRRPTGARTAARSRSSSSAWLQSIRPRSVRAGGVGAVRGPRSSSGKWSSRRAAIVCTGIVATRAAASSIASAYAVEAAADRRHRLGVARRRARTPVCAAVARSTKSRTDLGRARELGDGRRRARAARARAARGPSRRLHAHSGSRLVASTASLFSRRSRRSTNSAQASSTCSQLSSTSRARLSARWSAIASAIGLRSGFANAECGGHRLRHERAVGERCQLDPADAVREVVQRGVRDLDRQPRLAEPASAQDRHQRRPPMRAEHVGALALAADERRRCRRQVVRRLAHRPPATVVEDDAPALVAVAGRERAEQRSVGVRRPRPPRARPARRCL